MCKTPFIYIGVQLSNFSHCITITIDQVIVLPLLTTLPHPLVTTGICPTLSLDAEEPPGHLMALLVQARLTTPSRYIHSFPWASSMWRDLGSVVIAPPR